MAQQASELRIGSSTTQILSCVNVQRKSKQEQEEEKKKIIKQMFDAIEQGNYDQIISIIEGHPYYSLVDEKDSEGSTLLHRLVRNNNTEKVIKFLLTKQVNPYIFNNIGKLPVEIANDDRHLAYVRILSEYMLMPATMSKFEISPIHQAIFAGNITLYNILINNSNIKKEELKNLRDYHGRTLLHALIASRHIKSFYESVANIGIDINQRDNSGNTVVHFISQLNQYYLLREFLSKLNNIEDTNEQGQTILHMAVLHMAARAGTKETVQEIINFIFPKDLQAALPNLNKLARGETIPSTLRFEFEEKGIFEKYEKLKNFLDKSDSVGNTALHYAALAGDLEIIQLLIYFGANSDAKNNLGQMPLHLTKNPKVIEYLLTANNLVMEDINHFSALYYFAKNNININKLLYEKIKLAINTNIQAINLFTPFNDLINHSDIEGNTALHYAVLNNNKELIKLLNHGGADESPKNAEGKIPLHLAKSGEAVSLVSTKQNINNKDNANLTALHYAAIDNNISVIKELLRLGADRSAQDSQFKTPLFYAKSVEAAQYLTTKHNINILDKTGFTVLHYAMREAATHPEQKELTKLVEFFLSHQADINKDASDLVKNYGSYSTEEINEDHIPHLLEQAMDELNISSILHPELRTFIVTFLQKDLSRIPNDQQDQVGEEIKRIIQFFLSDLSNADYKSQKYNHPDNARAWDLIYKYLGINKTTPLIIAARYGRLDLVEISLKYHANVSAIDYLGKNCLHYLTEKSEDNFIAKKFTKEIGWLATKSHLEGNTPLHIASRLGNLPLVQLYTRTPIGLNTKNPKTGDTALHEAVLSKTPEVVQYLVEINGIDLNVTNANGLTPLMLAISHKNIPVSIIKAIYFKLNDEQINAVNSENGYTALHYAVVTRRVEVIRILERANPNIQDNQGNTPLHLAVKDVELHYDVVDELMKLKPDIWIMDKEEKLAIDVVIQKCRTDIDLLLINYTLAQPNYKNIFDKLLELGRKDIVLFISADNQQKELNEENSSRILLPMH